MNIQRTRSRKVALGVIAAGIAALSFTTALPANAATRYWTVQGTGATPQAAKRDADNRCIRSGGNPDFWASYTQKSGVWTATEQCSA
jgi:hypothetical protein